MFSLTVGFLTRRFRRSTFVVLAQGRLLPCWASDVLARQSMVESMNHASHHSINQSSDECSAAIIFAAFVVPLLIVCDLLPPFTVVAAQADLAF